LIEITAALKKIVNYAIYVAEPEKIILFGSVAHGRNDIHSDIDLLIITRQSYRRKELELQISSLAKEYALTADVLIHTPRDIEKDALNAHPFLNLVIKDGKILYDDAGQHSISEEANTI
jgi:predicted nucleotidyltransferase